MNEVLPGSVVRGEPPDRSGDLSPRNGKRGTAGDSPSPPSKSKASRTLLGAAATLCVFWAVASLTFPLGYDQALYALVGDTIVRGGMPFRDVWDMHGPLSGYLFAFARLLFGPTGWGVRLIDLFILAIASVALHRLITSLASRTAAHWTVVLFILTYASYGFNETAQPDGWTAFLLLVPFSFLYRESGIRPRHWAASGLAVGLATLVKPLFVLYLAIPFAVILMDRSATLRGLVTRSAAMIGAALLPILLMGLWFYSQDAHRELYEVHIGYTSSVYSGLSGLHLGNRLNGIINYLSFGKVVVLAQPAVVVGCLVLARRMRGALVISLLWLLLSVAIVLIQNAFYIYHWAILLPPLAILASVGLHGVLAGEDGAGRSRSPQHLLGLAMLLLLLLHASIRPAARAAAGFGYLAGSTDRTAYLGSFMGEEYEVGIGLAVAEYLRERTAEDEGVVVVAEDYPGILHLARRPTPFRMGGWSFPIERANGSEVQRRYREEYLSDLQRTVPRYVVVAGVRGDDQGEWDVRIGSVFPELGEYLAREYSVEQRFSHLFVLRSNRSGSDTSNFLRRKEFAGR